MTTEPLVLPRAVERSAVPRSLRVGLALALGALSTLVVLASCAGLTWPSANGDLLMVGLVLGGVGCSVSVRLAVRNALRP